MIQGFLAGVIAVRLAGVTGVSDILRASDHNQYMCITVRLQFNCLSRLEAHDFWLKRFLPGVIAVLFPCVSGVSAIPNVFWRNRRSNSGVIAVPSLGVIAVPILG